MQGNVALHTSAWIETLYTSMIYPNNRVALHTSAWIETKIPLQIFCPFFRRAPHERVD